MKTEIEFNINQNVKVKLTETGKAELKKQWVEWNSLYPKAFRSLKLPKEDEEGFSVWQLHNLMNELGHLCIMGRPLPFETTIKLNIKDK